MTRGGSRPATEPDTHVYIDEGWVHCGHTYRILQGSCDLIWLTALDTHRVHSFKRSKKSWEKGNGKKVRSQPSLPIGHGVNTPELWRKHKSW